MTHAPAEAPASPDDREGMVGRQASVLPPWFGPHGVPPPVLRVPLSMSAAVGAWARDLIGFARLQTRLATATGGWLELWAWDFFGARLRRRPGLGDAGFRARIRAELFRPRATRAALALLLRDLTGQEPRIFEPGRPADTGGIGVPSGLAIGVSGAVGSLRIPGAAFVEVYRTPEAGIPFAAGIGTPAGGIGVASRLVIGSLREMRGALTDADLLDAINAVRPAGVTLWVRMRMRVPEAPPLPPPDPAAPPGRLGAFRLGVDRLG